MTSADHLPATVLKRKAVVYVRQSTQAQVQTNLESQRRQYDLVEVARRRGFRDVEVIDDDLGRSASGMEARPGFEKLVAWLCAGEVGAVLCFDASRLARNGRDWHHLLELCGLVQARVIDLDGVYDPCRPNDRLLLGMKGSISEFETGIIRARMYDAARAKARRGELRISVPIGYIWHREIGVGFDPDLRIQEAIRLIFSRFRELGSARQVLLSMTADQVHFPRPSDSRKLTTFEWTLIRYRNVISVLKNPFYAGAYVYGKSEKRTEIVDGRARKSYGHGKPFTETGTTDASKADRIASATKRTITEKMEEDPAFYKEFSVLLEETIRDYREKRISEKEYLNNVIDLASRMARKDHGRRIPASIRSDEDAQAVFGVVEPVLKAAANGGINEDQIAEIAKTIVGVIRELHIVDVWSNEVAQNNMRNAIDDYFFDVVRDQKGVEIPVEQLDDLEIQIMDVARARFPG